MQRYPIVYLPIEFGSREFDSKALLAAAIAARGYAVIVGQQWLLYQNLQTLPSGAFLFKSFNKIHHQAMRLAKAAGHWVATLEEELLSHIERKLVVMSAMEGIFDIPDMIFANSDFEKNIFVELGGDTARIEVTGNGRVDILKPAYRAFFKNDIDAVNRRFGDFVLINTNFGVTNTIWESPEHAARIQIQAGYLDPNDPASVRNWHEQIEFEQANKAAILTAIAELARRRPTQKIVVRPHPGEALERWQGIFDGSPNVAIVREGAHVPWTLGCRLLLHTSCTTGFEAHVAGKTAFSLVPKPCWLSESFISNRLNPVFADPLAMVNAAEDYLNRGATSEKGQWSLAEASHYVWNIGEQSSVTRTADLLIKNLPAPGVRIPLAPLQPFPRPDKLKNKFNISSAQCTDVFQRIIAAAHIARPLNVMEIGESLFAITSSAST